MLDLVSHLQALQRPRLLVRAARTQVSNYHRRRHLARVLGFGKLPKPSAALLQLLDLEQELNQRRLAKDAGYLIARHLDILIAIMGEADFHFNGRQSPEPQQQKGAMTDPATAPDFSPYAGA